jgi:chromosome segregation ATPase
MTMIPPNYQSPDGAGGSADHNTQILLSTMEALRGDMRDVVKKIDALVDSQHEHKIETTKKLEGLEKKTEELERQKTALWQKIELHADKIAACENKIDRHQASDEASKRTGEKVTEKTGAWVRWVLPFLITVLLAFITVSNYFRSTP